MKRTSRFCCLLLSLLLTLPLVGCSASRAVRADAKATRVVATAGNVEILYEEIYYLAMNKIYDLKLAHGENALDDPARVQELKDFVAAALPSRQHALLSLAADYGIDIESGDVGKGVDDYMASVLADSFADDRDAYIESLAAEYLTDHYVRTFVAVEEYLPTAIILAMMERGELDTSDEAARARINGEDMIRTTHVFISRDNALYTEEENRAHAAEVQAKIAAKTTERDRMLAMSDALGGKYNNDYDNVAGHGYYFVRGEMDKAYEDAAFALAEYGVSDVVETDAGWYIIMRLPKDADYIADQQNFEVLKQKAYFVTLNTRAEAKLAELKTSFSMTELGNSLDLLDLDPIDPKGGEATPIIITVAAVLLVGGTLGLVSYRMAHKKRKK